MEASAARIGPRASVLGSDTPSAEVRLDYDARAFVVAVAGECETSEDLFDARLESSPFTTLAADFFIAEQSQSSPVRIATAVTPYGLQSGASPVTISGAEFGGPFEIGSAAAASFTVDTESQIDAIAQPGSGFVF
jgi:hypothetical protein